MLLIQIYKVIYIYILMSLKLKYNKNIVFLIFGGFLTKKK